MSAQPADVLAELNRRIAIEQDRYPRVNGEVPAGTRALIEARDAVAELIEAGHAAMNACTEADQNAADGRLVAALARCGGA